MFRRAYPKQAKLKDGRTVVIRPLETGDFERLLAFFQSLSEEERLFLRHNVCDPELIRKWTQELDFDRVIPLVAVDADQIVADGSLHMTLHGWSQHAGQIRLVTARAYRHVGLGTVIARELVAVAEQRGLAKLQAHVIEDDLGAMKMFRTLGFELAAVLKDMVKDQDGKLHNLTIMINDVADLSRIMEDWIQDSMIPAFRVPGHESGG